MSQKRRAAARKRSTATKATRRSVRRRSSGGTAVEIRYHDPAPAWQKNLENNLIEQGFTRAKARELVKLAAS
jgi:hypothetical protein